MRFSLSSVIPAWMWMMMHKLVFACVRKSCSRWWRKHNILFCVKLSHSAPERSQISVTIPLNGCILHIGDSVEERLYCKCWLFPFKMNMKGVSEGLKPTWGSHEPNHYFLSARLILFGSFISLKYCISIVQGVEMQSLCEVFNISQAKCCLGMQCILRSSPPPIIYSVQPGTHTDKCS